MRLLYCIGAMSIFIRAPDLNNSMLSQHIVDCLVAVYVNINDQK